MPQPLDKPLKAIAGAAVLLAALGLGFIASKWVFAPGPGGPPDTHATLLNHPRSLPVFLLTDHRGRRFAPEQLRGRWTIMFFGFTHCPDVCPTTLLTLARVYESLEKLPAERRPQVVFVSVDPQRDTTETLATYVPHFNAGFLGVRGPREALEELTVPLGVAYQYIPDSQGGYTVDHTAALFLINPRGEFNALFSHPHDAARIAADYEAIIDYLDRQS